MILGGYELNDNDNIRNVSTVYISGSIPSSQGNFGLVIVPGTMHLVRSGKDTIEGHKKLYDFSSLSCREVWVNVTVDAYLTKGSGTEYPDYAGVKLEQDTVYKIPVSNINQFYLSSTGATCYWSAFN